LAGGCLEEWALILQIKKTPTTHPPYTTISKNDPTLPTVTVTVTKAPSVGILKFFKTISIQKILIKKHPQHICQTLQCQKTTQHCQTEIAPPSPKKESSYDVNENRKTEKYKKMTIFFWDMTITTAPR